mmetsp:Transcript_20660/g.49660  ORF Transcript_20660/g.49660 Transcript_20660/m.49660 type:complete len:218 (+) Transcript_20660:266-919(+)
MPGWNDVYSGPISTGLGGRRVLSAAAWQDCSCCCRRHCSIANHHRGCRWNDCHLLRHRWKFRRIHRLLLSVLESGRRNPHRLFLAFRHSPPSNRRHRLPHRHRHRADVPPARAEPPINSRGEHPQPPSLDLPLHHCRRHSPQHRCYRRHPQPSAAARSNTSASKSATPAISRSASSDRMPRDSVGEIGGGIVCGVWRPIRRSFRWRRGWRKGGPAVF